MSMSCPARADPVHTQWGFCPSTGAAILFTVLFALVTFMHISQAIFYKKAFCWVIIGSGLLQTINYIFRIVSINNPNSLRAYATWFVLILIAPLFTNAYAYMVMGRMVWNYIDDAKLYRVTAWRFGTYFVGLDIIALIIQVSGASIAAGDQVSPQQALRALHIYMGGVGLQQFFILLFSLFAIKFHRTLLQQARQGAEEVLKALPLLYALYAVLILITMRIIFRICEYSQGLQSNIPNHEAYQYCLDSLPMIIALVILNIIHPGRIMPGNDGDIPGRKERKRNGIHNKSEKQTGGSSSQEA